MSSKSSSTSMASVWDTLNKMKARQQAASTSVQKHRQADTARRDAQLAFESAVQKGGNVDELFKTVFDSQAVQSVVESHKQRLQTGGESATKQELLRVRKALDAAKAELAVVAQAVKKGNKALDRMSSS